MSAAVPDSVSAWLAGEGWMVENDEYRHDTVWLEVCHDDVEFHVEHDNAGTRVRVGMPVRVWEEIMSKVVEFKTAPEDP